MYRRYRYWFFALFFLAFPPVFYGALKAWEGTANRVEDWLPEKFEETQRLVWFFQHFGSDELLMIGWPGSNLDDPRLEQLAAGLLEPVQTPEGPRPAFFRRVFTGRQVLADFMQPPLSLDRAAAIERMTGWLVGPDRQQTCAVALVSDAGLADRHGAVARVFAVARQVTGLPDAEIHVAGPTVDGVAIDEASKNALLSLNEVSHAVCALLLWLAFRSLWTVVMVFVTAVFNQQLSMALVYYSGGQMDSMLLLMTSLVYVLSISGSIHLLSYYRDALRHGGLEGATTRAVKHALVPYSIAAVTTAIGAFSLNVSQLVPINRFSNYSAVAVILSFGMLLIAIPMWLEQFPVRRWANQVEAEPAAAAPPRFRALLEFVIRRNLWMVAGAVAVMVACGFGCARIQTTARLHDLLAPGAKVVRDYLWLETNIGPLVPIEVVLRFPRNEAEMLRPMQVTEEVREAIAGLEGVGATISAVSFAPPLPSAESRLGQTVARRAVFERRLRASRDRYLQLQYLADTRTEHLWRITARLPAHREVDYGLFLRRLDDAVRPIVAAAAREFPGLSVTFAGGIPLVHKAQDQLLRDLANSAMQALFLITLTTAILLRSARAGLWTMLPNVLPVVIVFGVIGWLGLEIEIGAAMTASVALGITVDDTVHCITWFRRGIGQGLSRHDAVRFAYAGYGVAVTQTALVCSLGLLVFAFSEFLPVSRFGWLMFTLLTTAVLCDLAVTPAMLASPLGRLFEPRRRGTSAAVADEPTINQSAGNGELSTRRSPSGNDADGVAQTPIAGDEPESRP